MKTDREQLLEYHLNKILNAWEGGFGNAQEVHQAISQAASDFPNKGPADDEARSDGDTDPGSD